LGVGEGEPDLGDFVFIEIVGKFIDMSAEEGGVGDFLFQALFCADIETVAFDVNAEEIAVGIHFAEADCIFAFATGKLEGEGVVVFEEGRPLAGHSFRVLEDVGEGFDRFESDELLLTHRAQNYKKAPPFGGALAHILL
jgi:hypothetical protein